MRGNGAMFVLKIASVLGVTFAAVVAALLAAQTMPTQRVAHDPLHVNCPPGSHKPWSAAHGASFTAGRRLRGAATGDQSPGEALASDRLAPDSGELRRRVLTAGRR